MPENGSLGREQWQRTKYNWTKVAIRNRETERQEAQCQDYT